MASATTPTRRTASTATSLAAYRVPAQLVRLERLEDEATAVERAVGSALRDGHAAGSDNVIEIHGNIRDIRCMRCDYENVVRSYGHFRQLPPFCPECDFPVSPDVVLFGEMLPPEKVGVMERELRTGFDLIVSVGTTSVFPYIAGPVVLAARRGIPTIEINPGPTEVSSVVDIKLASGAAETLDRIWTLATTH